MNINVQEKKKFLNWLVSTVSFSRREVSWVLNYLANHEAILTNVHIVEGVMQTDRGLSVRSTEIGGEPFVLTIQNQTFYDIDQIFHEIRMNWKQPLYLECIFPNPWEKPLYLAVLEDNPFERWNDHVDEEVQKNVTEYLDKEAMQLKIEKLYRQIDLALENGDRDAFLELSDEVNRFKLDQKEKSH